MVRVSLLASTVCSIVFIVLHTASADTLPSDVEILRSASSPYHATVVKVDENTSLSCIVMFGVDVAAADAAPVRVSIADSASTGPPPPASDRRR
jgi:hypothetical protein